MAPNTTAPEDTRPQPWKAHWPPKDGESNPEAGLCELSKTNPGELLITGDQGGGIDKGRDRLYKLDEDIPSKSLISSRDRDESKTVG